MFISKLLLLSAKVIAGRIFGDIGVTADATGDLVSVGFVTGEALSGCCLLEVALLASRDEAGTGFTAAM